jgi:hypothetical protein
MSIEILTEQILNKITRLGKCQHKFIVYLFSLWLSIRGRHNCMNLARHGRHGNEATYGIAEVSNMIGCLVKTVNKFSLKSGMPLAISKAYSMKQEAEEMTKLKLEEHIVTRHSFYFKKKDTLDKVLTKNITYLEAADNYSKIVTIQGDFFIARLLCSFCCFYAR